MPVTCEPDQPVSWPNIRLLVDQLDDLALWLGATTHTSLLEETGTPFGLKRTLGLNDLGGGATMYVKFELDSSDAESAPIVTKTILVDAALQPYDLSVSTVDVAERPGILEELAQETPSELYFKWSADGCFCESLFSVGPVAGGYTIYETDVPDVDPHHDCGYSLKVPQPGDLLDSSQYFFNYKFFPKFNRRKGLENLQTFIMCDGGPEDGLLLEYDTDKTLIAAYRKCIAGRFVWPIRRKWFDKIWKNLFNLFDCANNGGTQGSLYFVGRETPGQAYLGSPSGNVFQPDMLKDITAIEPNSTGSLSFHVNYALHYRDVLRAAHGFGEARYSPETGSYFNPPHAFSDVEDPGCIINVLKARGPAQPWRVGLADAPDTFGHSETVSTDPLQNDYTGCEAEYCDEDPEKLKHYCRTLKELENVIEATRWVLIPKSVGPGCNACDLEDSTSGLVSPGLDDTGYNYFRWRRENGVEVTTIDTLAVADRFPSVACKDIIKRYVQPFWPYMLAVSAQSFETFPGDTPIPTICYPVGKINIALTGANWLPDESPSSFGLNIPVSPVHDPNNGSFFALLGVDAGLSGSVIWEYNNTDPECEDVETSAFTFSVSMSLIKTSAKTSSGSSQTSPDYTG